MKKKLVCLSSGSTLQYRLDILRVMAMPEGAEIQFRYDISLIDGGIRAGLGDDRLHDAPVLIAYLDMTMTLPTPGSRLVYPCRHARLINSEQLGQFVVLRFRLGALSDCSDLAALRAQIAPKSPESKGGMVKGFWVFENDFTKYCAESNDMTVWQRAMRELGRSTDFASEEFFFRVMGLYRRGHDAAILPSKGEYKLRTNTEYEWKIFHFHPDSDDHRPKPVSTMLQVASASEDVKSVTSPVLAIDSSYDLKSFHFRTAAPTVTTYAAFTISFEDAKPAADEVTTPSTRPELFLPVKIVPSWVRAMFSVCFLTVLLFGQQYISATSKGGIPHHTSFVLLGLALLTALVAVYALKKTL